MEMNRSQDRRGADGVNLCSPKACLVKIGSNYSVLIAEIMGSSALSITLGFTP
jgi:hypothetical protein